jgi:3-oxoacyl-[acyl-carrier protein] reductase
MDFGIAGRKAIVCASSQGLGLGCATALAAEGCEVVINGRDAEKLERVADELRKLTGATIIAAAGDVSTAAGQEALLAACPNPDILVNNNAGPPFRDFQELDREKLLAGITANFVTPIEMTQRVIEGMAERGFGRIVNITSSSVLAPIAGLDLSSGARAGLTAFLKGVAQQMAGKGVTINNILPGSFDTDRLRSGQQRTAEQRGVSVETVAEEKRQAIPAKRFGTPDEFGSACAFLCSMQAGYITGQNLLIDGGAFPGAF